MVAQDKTSPPNLVTFAVCLTVVFGGLFVLDAVASPLGLIGVALATLLSALSLIVQARRRRLSIDAKMVAVSYALVSAVVAVGFASAVMLRFGFDLLMFYFAAIGALLVAGVTWLTAASTLNALSRAPKSLEGISQ